jgi:N6-adenosine-specific RNA methylase IME4
MAEFNTLAATKLNNIVNLGYKYGTIYADPPWQYSNQATRSSTDKHYNTLDLKKIASLPISKLTMENAHLHLWTTNAFLFDAKKIIESWGFEYKSCFVWVKPQMGIGNYWRVSHEFMLFGIKGKCPFRDRGQKSWGEFDRTRHSAKPEKIAKIIERTSPGPYLELFARQTRNNWTVWGNDIERTLFNERAFKADI